MLYYNIDCFVNIFRSKHIVFKAEVTTALKFFLNFKIYINVIFNMKKITDSEIIEMAWCDKTSFDDIRVQTGLSEKEVISIMRSSMKQSSFRMWRERVSGRKTKHRHKISN